MKSFLLSITLLLIISFSLCIAFMSLIGRVMPYDGEIRYIVVGNNGYTPYALDALRGVNHRMQPTQRALFTNWSPNVQYLLLLRYSSATDLLNVENGTLHPLYNGSITPYWSPDGTHLSFVVQTGELFLANGDGSARTQFMSQYSYTYSDLAYSTDSRHLAYVSINDLFVLNLTDSTVTRLTDSVDVVEMQPIWSHDGQFIAYLWQATDYPEYHLTVVSLDGQQHADFVSNARIYSTRWLSDNMSISFYTRTTETSLYIADISSESIRLLPVSYSLQPIGMMEGLIGEQPTLHFLWYEDNAGTMTFYEDDVDISTGEILRRQPFVMRNNVSLILEEWMVGVENNHICIWSRATGEERACFVVIGGSPTDIRWLDEAE